MSIGISFDSMLRLQYETYILILLLVDQAVYELRIICAISICTFNALLISVSRLKNISNINIINYSYETLIHNYINSIII